LAKQGTIDNAANDDEQVDVVEGKKKRSLRKLVDIGNDESA
jgi:hypothetical protein